MILTWVIGSGLLIVFFWDSQRTFAYGRWVGVEFDQRLFLYSLAWVAALTGLFLWVGTQTKSPVFRAIFCLAVLGLIFGREELFDENAEHRGGLGQLPTQLMILRGQIEFYGENHSGGYPDLIVHSWIQMTHPTDVSGALILPNERDEISSIGSLGPYLEIAPSNAFSYGRDTVCSVDAITQHHGWAYDRETGEIYAVVSRERMEALGLGDGGEWCLAYD